MNITYKNSPIFFLMIFLLSLLGTQLKAQEPSYGTASVDGNNADWSLSDDLFASMWEAGNANKPNAVVLSKLYLRYDCAAQRLYVLVLAEPGQVAMLRPDDAFVKLGNSTKLIDGNLEGTASNKEFSWVYDGNTLIGFEAGFDFEEGTYTNLNVHIQINPGRTSAVNNRAIPLEIICEDEEDNLCDENTISYYAGNAYDDTYMYSRSDHSIALHDFYGQGQEADLSFEEGAILSYETDGSAASITGIAFFQDGALGGTRWEVTATFGEKNELTEPKKELKARAYIEDGGFIDVQEWILFLLEEGSELKEIDEEGNYTGRVISLTRMPENGQYGLQIGQGASGKNTNLGASVWFFWTFEGNTGSGDFNIDIEPICLEDENEVMMFSLVNTETNEVIIHNLSNGAVINVNDYDLSQFGIFLKNYPLGTKSVALELSGVFSHTQTENMPPFSLFGDNINENTFNGRAVQLGEYTLKADAYSEKNLLGNLIKSRTITFSFVDANFQETPPTQEEQVLAVNPTTGTGDMITLILPHKDSDTPLEANVIYQGTNTQFSITVPAHTTQIQIPISSLNIPEGSIYLLSYQYGSKKKTVKRMLK